MSDTLRPEPEPPREITLEEWIESCQSCCGIEPESWQKPQPEPGEATAERVESEERLPPP
jgi:hypothetical protein